VYTLYSLIIAASIRGSSYRRNYREQAGVVCGSEIRDHEVRTGSHSVGGFAQSRSHKSER
jgi:hypothetical protein